MSDNYVHVIPEEPGLVPDTAKRQAALKYFHRIAPEADEIAAEVFDTLQFIHCGGNFEKIGCPACGTEIEVGRWQDWMDKDFKGKDHGFVLSIHSMPCCGARHSLHALNYEWPEGFARFDLRAQNPKIGKLSKDQQDQFESRLGCAVRVIYMHL